MGVSYSPAEPGRFDTTNLEDQPPVPVEPDLMDRLLPPLPEGAAPEPRLVSDVLRVTSLRVIYSRLSDLPRDAVLSILRRYGSGEVVERLEGVLDLRGLAAVLDFVEIIYASYGRPQLACLVDEEEGEPFAAVILIPGCDWEAWDRVARRVKAEMRKAGLGDLASKVAIICLEGLRGPPR